MGSVHALVSVILTAECVNVCQHFVLCYAVRTSLQAYSARELLSLLSGLGWGSTACDVIRDLAIYSEGLFAVPALFE
jgi:hypothetical protein